MKILVTGANGYLGQGIVKQLLDDGHIVVASDLKTDCVDRRAIRHDGNIFDCLDPFSFFGEPDVLLHLAWRNGFVHNSDTHFIDLPLHKSFIKKMVESSVRKIAVLGTMHEIGFFEGCADENVPCHPLSNYGKAKNDLRQYIQNICLKNNVSFQWLRGFYIVGNPQNGASIFSKIYYAAKEGIRVFPFTSGTNKCDFLNYEDFCLQVASAVEQDNILGIINICSGVPQTLSERVERFISDNNLDIKLDYGKYPTRPYDSNAIWGDSTKIKTILSLRNMNYE